jgi:hypothetical protein
MSWIDDYLRAEDALATGTKEQQRSKRAALDKKPDTEGRGEEGGVMQRWRMVIQRFRAKADSKEPLSIESFEAGERLFVRNDDGSHVLFVREGADHEPFITASDEFAAATEVCDGPEPKGE